MQNSNRRLDATKEANRYVADVSENKASESAMVKMAIHMVILVTPKEESEYSLNRAKQERG